MHGELVCAISRDIGPGRQRELVSEQRSKSEDQDFHEMRVSPNENKMSDGGRGRVSLGLEMWKSFQKWSAQRSAVRSIAWVDLGVVDSITNRPDRPV